MYRWYYYHRWWYYRFTDVTKQLGTSFDVKDLGSLCYFLGIEVARSCHGISLSQRKYVLDLLRDTGMMGCRPASTPMDPNLKLSLESGELLYDPSLYQHLVGRLSSLILPSQLVWWANLCMYLDPHIWKLFIIYWGILKLAQVWVSSLLLRSSLESRVTPMPIMLVPRVINVRFLYIFW